MCIFLYTCPVLWDDSSDDSCMLFLLFLKSVLLSFSFLMDLCQQKEPFNSNDTNIESRVE